MDCSPPLVVLVPWRCYSTQNLSKRPLVSRYTCNMWTFQRGLLYIYVLQWVTKLERLKACSHICPPMELIDRQPASRDNSNKACMFEVSKLCFSPTCTLLPSSFSYFGNWVCQLTHDANKGKKSNKLLIKSPYLSLQLSTQVGYIAERKVSRCEGTARMASINQPLGDSIFSLAFMAHA